MFLIRVRSRGCQKQCHACRQVTRLAVRSLRATFVVKPNARAAICFDAFYAALHRLNHALRSFDVIENHAKAAIVVKLASGIRFNHLAMDLAVGGQQKMTIVRKKRRGQNRRDLVPAMSGF